MTNPILTVEANEFRTHLWPGDILVFDSLGLDAGLVQWGDNVPANHVSMVVDDNNLFEANREHDKKGDVDAVRSVDIGQRLDYYAVRTTTALRHVDVSAKDDPRTAAAVTWARSQEGRGTFAYLATAALGPLAFQRSFAKELGEAPWMTDALRTMFDKALLIAKTLVLADKCALSCSEFIYRCYDQGTEMKLKIFVAKPLSNAPTILADEQNELVTELTAAKKLCEFGRPFSSIADWVTPGDFLRSSSLQAVAVLHRSGKFDPPAVGVTDDDIAAI